MAVTSLSVQTILALTGIVPSYGAVSHIGDGFTFANTGREFIAVVNADSNPTTLTMNSLVPCSQGSDHNEGGAVAAGATRFFGPFPTGRYNDASNLCAGALSNITSVTVGVFKLPT